MIPNFKNFTQPIVDQSESSMIFVQELKSDNSNMFLAKQKQLE